MCVPESTEDHTGRYQWNYTVAGEYAFHPCPNGAWFDGEKEVFAYRPCHPPRQLKLLRNNRLSEDARWGEPTTKYCRFTSNVTNELQEIREAIIDAIRDIVRTYRTQFSLSTFSTCHAASHCTSIAAQRNISNPRYILLRQLHSCFCDSRVNFTREQHR